MTAGMNRDRLFLLQPGFEDPAYPGKRFYCWHCALLEGVLASFPDLESRLDVERVSWPRPRASVIDVVGEKNQSLPLLVLAGDVLKALRAQPPTAFASSPTRMRS
jgi:hypothetical protein